MSEQLTREDVIELIGALDDGTITEILKCGATRGELAEARAWLENDEALVNEGRPIPSGRTARVVEIISARDDDLPAVPKL